MKTIYRFSFSAIIILAGLFIFLPDCGARTLTAQQVMTSAAAKINRAGSVSASFRLSGASSAAGSIVVSGKRFRLELSGYTTWFDGTTMWTLNRSAREVTVSKPSAAEIAESNPLSYVGGWQGNFTASFPKNAKSTDTVILTAKSRKLGVRGAVITFNASRLPSKIVVTMTDGSKTTVTLSSIRTGKSLSASSFRFDAKKHKGVKTIDLR